MVLKRKWIWFVLYMLVISYTCLSIMPASDDWVEGAAPWINDGTYSRLLPTRAFWRPVEKGIGYFLGAHPELFPALNHIIVLFGHFLLCALLFAILKKVLLKTKAKYVGVLFFMLSPGCVATVYSIDGINQCYALVFGVLAWFSYFRYREKNTNLFLILYIFMAYLATLTKENGIVWFYAPIFIYWFYERFVLEKATEEKTKKLKEMILPTACCIAYFIIRFALMGQIALGADQGRYGFHLFSFIPVRNLFVTFMGAFSTVDTIAFFVQPRMWIVVAITLFSTLLFWGWCICSTQKCEIKAVIYWWLINLFIATPIILATKTSEMSVYQNVFISAIFVGYIVEHSKISLKKSIIVLTLLFLCMIGVFAHKAYCMYTYGIRTQIFLQEHRAEIGGTPSKALIDYVQDCPLQYSIYVQHLGSGLCEDGISFRSLWGWMDTKNIRMVRYKSYDEIDHSQDDNYDTVIVLSRSGKMEVLKNVKGGEENYSINR